MLKGNNILQTLSLGDNQISNNGTKAFARVLRRHNTSLLMLDLHAKSYH